MCSSFYHVFWERFPYLLHSGRGLCGFLFGRSRWDQDRWLALCGACLPYLDRWRGLRWWRMKYGVCIVITKHWETCCDQVLLTHPFFLFNMHHGSVENIPFDWFLSFVPAIFWRHANLEKRISHVHLFPRREYIKFSIQWAYRFFVESVHGTLSFPSGQTYSRLFDCGWSW